MKKVVVFLPMVLAFIFFSCSTEGDSFTPYIQFSYFLVNPSYSNGKVVSAQDTLQLRSIDDYYVLDTISVTDTVIFAVGFGSYSNDLIAARVNFDANQLDVRATISKEIKAILLPTSDLAALQLLVNPGYNYFALPVGYKPVSSGTHRINFVVESDSRFSPNSVVFYQPVR